MAEVDLWTLSDLCTPWCLHVVVTLRVAEHIAEGRERIGELAAACGCDAYALERVLELLVCKGVFERPAPGRFSLNGAARRLLDPALRLGLDLEGLGGRFAHAWGSMLEYTRTGAPAYARTFGLPFWEDLDAHPALRAQFDDLMGKTGHGTPDPHFEITGGWGEVRSIVDVGGGTGSMLAEILRAHPAMRGTLVDVPASVAPAENTFADAGVAARAAAVGQSFFDPLPAGADLYLLRGVINDWPDREGVAILRRCAEAAGRTGRVVVLKGVCADGAPRPLVIEMVLVGGKQRTVSEFTELARQAGLRVVAAGPQDSGYFAVECRAS